MPTFTITSDKKDLDKINIHFVKDVFIAWILRKPLRTQGYEISWRKVQ